MLCEEVVEFVQMALFLLPHVRNDGFEFGVVLEDGVLASVDEVCAEFAGLVDAELGERVSGR